MLLSMTGYGRVEKAFHNKRISIELRSLNSKFTDIRIKSPQYYREKEIEFRRILNDRLERGKIEFSLDIVSMEDEGNSVINNSLFKSYYRQLRQLMQELDIPSGDILQAILRLPDVVSGPTEGPDPEEWAIVCQGIEEVTTSFDLFRKDEGKVIEKDLRLRIHNILDGLQLIPALEEERISRTRSRIYQSLEEYLGKENIDESRFEQEILFYLEKMDISEEKSRLAQHCNYFLDELDAHVTQKGRKLAFISQEIGREINTLGAKSYSSEIQRIVVEMKDELEKIKEQVANCL
jgi:uncharacterized protein (TIGR00255 family)